MLNVSDSLSQAICPFFFFHRILFFKSFFSSHCFQLLNSSRRPGVILFPDFGCFSFSLKHHGSVLLVLSFATFWENPSVDAEVDDEKNGENEHNNGDDADDYDLHCCKERPIRQNSSLLFLLIIL